MKKGTLEEKWGQKGKEEERQVMGKMEGDQKGCVRREGIRQERNTGSCL